MVGFLALKIETIMTAAASSLNVASSMKEIKYNPHRGIKGDWKLINTLRLDPDYNIIDRLGMTLLVIVNRAIRYFYRTVYFYFLPLFIVCYIFFDDDFGSLESKKPLG